MELTFIRHGQSEGNAARLWQGRGNTPLTARGREQATALGARLDPNDYDLVISSDLDRAIQTATIAGTVPEQRAELGEMDLGAWEGLTFEEVKDRHGDVLEAIRNGEDVPFGSSGETVREFEARIAAAVQGVLNSLDHGDRVLIVAHGGSNNAAVRHLLGLDTPMFRILGAPTNTSITRFTVRPDGHVTMETYNDAAHLGPVSDWKQDRIGEGAVVLDTIRHAVTPANLDGRVQGQLDFGLHPDGEEQARYLAEWIGPVERVVTSPSGRAAQTAALVFGDHQAEPHDGLQEIHMGEWQGRMWSEISESDAGAVRALEARQDLPRGGSGETYAQLQKRVRTTIDEIAEASGPGRVGVVSHGAALRSYVADVLGFGYDRAHALGRLQNTAVSRIVYTSDGPVIADFNVTYHLNGSRR